MKIVFFSILLLYSCFCNSQTNRNEDFVLKGIQAAKVPIALKRYHRSVVSGTIIALRAVPPVSL